MHLSEPTPWQAADYSLGFLISDISRLMRAHFNALAAPLGLTQAQARVLVHLSRCEGASQRALADLLEVQPITLLRQIDRLAEAGLIERRPNPHDRRAQCLYLTDRAQPVLADLWRHAERLRATVTDGLDSDQYDALLETLAGIKDRLSALDTGTNQDDQGDLHG